MSDDDTNNRPDAGGLPGEVIDAVVARAGSARTRRLVDGVEADSTRAGRVRYWGLFERFCGDYGGRGPDGERLRGLTALPAAPDTVTEFVGYLAHRGYAPATIQACLSIVRAKHRIAGEPVPDGVQAAAAVRGYEAELRAAGWRPKRSAPARTRQLQQLVEVCDPMTAQGLRDRAMVLLGYSIAGTRTALAAMDMTDLTPLDARQHEVRVFRGERRERRLVPVPHWGTPARGRCGDPLCPLCATFAWIGRLNEGGVRRGALFRPVDRSGNIAGIRAVAGGHDERLSVTAVNLILRRLRRRAELPENVTPHSLRAGFAVESIERGVDERDVRRHGGWVAHSTAFTVYTRGLLDQEAAGPGRRAAAVARPNPLLTIARDLRSSGPQDG